MKVEQTPPEVVNEEIPASEAISSEEKSAETSPNQELVALLEKYAPGEDTSTPDGIMQAALKVIMEFVPIIDKVEDLAITSYETAAFVNDLLSTGDVPKSLARNFDPEELKAIWEEVTDDSNEEDRQMYASKVAEARSRKELVEKNVEISKKAIAKYEQEENGWPADKAKAFMEFVVRHYDDANDGLISEDNLEILEKGFKYDDDVTEAEELGKVMGRNEQIVTKKASQKDKENLLPDLNGGAGTPAPATEEDPFIAGLRRKVEQKPILS